MSAPGYVYVIAQGQYAKIGYSASPMARLAQLQTGSPIPLELLCYTPAGMKSEQAIHSALRRCSLPTSGEWYFKNDIEEIIDHIERGDLARAVVVASNVEHKFDLAEWSRDADNLLKHDLSKRQLSEWATVQNITFGYVFARYRQEQGLDPVHLMRCSEKEYVMKMTRCNDSDADEVLRILRVNYPKWRRLLERCIQETPVVETYLSDQGAKKEAAV